MIDGLIGDGEQLGDMRKNNNPDPVRIGVGWVDWDY
jgi:hypothetical protein